MTASADADNLPEPHPDNGGSSPAKDERAGSTGETYGRQLGAIEQQEYQLLLRVLREEKGAIRRAAAKLGISHQSLLRRLKKWPEIRAASVDPIR